MSNNDKEKNMKRFGSYVYITKFGTNDFEGVINALSEALEKTVSKYGPAHDLKWIVKEYDPKHDTWERGEAKIVPCMHMWSIGWKAMFEVENEQKL